MRSIDTSLDWVCAATDDDCETILRRAIRPALLSQLRPDAHNPLSTATE